MNNFIKITFGLMAFILIAPACDKASETTPISSVSPPSPSATNSSSISSPSPQPVTTSLEPTAIAQAMNGATVRQANAILKEFGDVRVSEPEYDDPKVPFESRLYEKRASTETSKIAVIESSRNHADWIYMFFHKQAEQWKPIGSLALPGLRLHQSPDFRIKHDASGSESWFVIRCVGGMGTGYFNEEEIWYRITGAPIQEDLRYVVKRVDWMSASEPVFVKAIGYPSDNIQMPTPAGQQVDPLAVEVNYQIILSDSATDHHLMNAYDADLLHTEKKIRYEWDAQQKKFIMVKDGYSDETLLDFTPDHIRSNLSRNYSDEMFQLAKSTVPFKQNWIEKINKLP